MYQSYGQSNTATTGRKERLIAKGIFEESGDTLAAVFV